MQEIFLKVYGGVQGVFFRHHAKKNAHGLNLCGWVRNAPDGTVEILAQGAKENLEKLIVWASRGPDSAQVEKIETTWRETTAPYSSFEIV